MLDTNSIDLRTPLETNPERLLLDAARTGQIRLIVPELVIREVMNKWLERAGAQLDAARAQVEKLVAYGLAGNVPDRAEVIRRREEVEAAMRRVLADAGAEIPDFPAVSHEVVVQRALDRRQPFDSHGKDGYRDTVLWHTVLDIAAEANVVLVSNDGRAFAERKDEAKLAPRLASEVREATGQEGRVRLVRDLRELTNELADIDEATLAEVSGLVRERSFRTLLEEALEDAVPDIELDMQAVIELNVGVPVEHASIAGLQELGVVTPRRAYTLPNGEALVDLDVVAGLAIGVQFRDRGFAQAVRHNPDFWLVRDEQWDGLPAGQIVTVGTTRLAHIDADVSIALPAGRLERLRAVGVRIAPEDEGFEEPQVTDDAD
jgi:PIN domain